MQLPALVTTQDQRPTLSLVPPSVPAAVYVLIPHCWSKDPAARPGAAAVLQTLEAAHDALVLPPLLPPGPDQQGPNPRELSLHDLVQALCRFNGRAEVVQAIAPALQRCTRQGTYAVAEAGAIEPILRALRTHIVDANAVLKLCQLVFHVANSQHITRAFARAGILPLLAEALSVHSESAVVVGQICQAVRFSIRMDKNSQTEAFEVGLAARLVGVLQRHAGESVAVAGSGFAMANFCVHNPTNQMALIDCGILAATAAVLSLHIGNADVTSATLGPLYNLSKDKRLKDAFLSAGLPAIVRQAGEAMDPGHEGWKRARGVLAFLDEPPLGGLPLAGDPGVT